MKYTSLFCAAVAAMSMQAIAAVPQGALYGDDFEGYDPGPVQGNNNFGTPTTWTVGTEDSSEIVATHFDTRGQALKLNTNGETLSLAAETTANYTATVKMKVEMVASDTMVDMSGDTTTQTALFLYKPDENSDDTTLFALSYDSQGETNVWQALTADGFALADKATADIEITIEYDHYTATYKVNDTTFAAVPLANPNHILTQKHLASVAFKGTGYVDDLFVSAAQTGTYATFIYELAGVEDTPDDKNIEDFEMDDEVPDQTGYNVFAALYERVNDEDSKLADLVLGANNLWSIDETTYNFQEGHTYVVKAWYEAKSVTVNIVDDNDAVIATDTSKKWFESFSYTLPAGASISGWSVGQDDYEEEDPIEIASLEADVVTIILHDYDAGQSGTKTWTTADVEAGSFSWTGYDPAAGTATFTCTLTGMPGANDSFGSFTVTTVTALGGSTTDQAVTVTPVLTALPTLTGTVSGLPTNGDSLFLIGVKDAAAAPAAGE